MKAPKRLRVRAIGTSNDFRRSFFLSYLPIRGFVNLLSDLLSKTAYILRLDKIDL